MSNDSFDPKKWTDSPATPPATHARPQIGPSPEDGTDFWRAATAEAQPAVRPTAGEALHASAEARSTAAIDRRMVLGGTLSATVLTLAAGAAWLTRHAPADSGTAARGAAPPIDGGLAAGQEERAINLTGIEQLGPALVEAGIRANEAQAAAAAAATAMRAPGDVHAIIVMQHGPDGTVLRQMRASLADGSGVVLSRRDDGTFASEILAADLTRQIKVLRGEIDSESFYTSAVSAGLVDSLIPEFINAFGYDFNLASEVSPGDVFEVAYDQAVNNRGEAYGPPTLLYGLLTTATKGLALYRFEPPGGKPGWFDGNGSSTKRGLMRTPVDGARITSNFGMRFHPVLHYNKLHKGTDFAAPIGTPIFAAANATVEWAAMKGANGNLTILKHDNGWETYYLHQSAFMPGVTAGARVSQGQHIGNIGTTGRSTGPHLHYEVHIAGEPVDPLSVPADDSKRDRLEGEALAAFNKQRDRIDLARARGDG